jgi:hypothetical protein
MNQVKKKRSGSLVEPSNQNMKLLIPPAGDSGSGTAAGKPYILCSETTKKPIRLYYETTHNQPSNQPPL